MFLAAGCSFTATDTACDGPMWPEYLSDMLGMDHTNVGVGGASNQEIFHQIVDNYQDIDHVFVVWTGYEREFLWTRSINPIAWEELGIIDNPKKPYHDFKDTTKYFDMQAAYDNTMRWKNLARHIVPSLFEQQGVRAFAGNKKIPHYVGPTMSKTDHHPNTKGHKMIAEQFYIQYCETHS